MIHHFTASSSIQRKETNSLNTQTVPTEYQQKEVCQIRAAVPRDGWGDINAWCGFDNGEVGWRPRREVVRILQDQNEVLATYVQVEWCRGPEVRCVHSETEGLHTRFQDGTVPAVLCRAACQRLSAVTTLAATVCVTTRVSNSDSEVDDQTLLAATAELESQANYYLAEIDYVVHNKWLNTLVSDIKLLLLLLLLLWQFRSHVLHRQPLLVTNHRLVVTQEQSTVVVESPVASTHLATKSHPLKVCLTMTCMHMHFECI